MALAQRQAVQLHPASCQQPVLTCLVSHVPRAPWHVVHKHYWARTVVYPMFKGINEWRFRKTKQIFPWKMNFIFFSNWSSVVRQYKGCKKHKSAIEKHQPNWKKSLRNRGQEDLCSRTGYLAEKIYKTPCKFMLVFRRNSVMAFKCQIIKSSLILDKKKWFLPSSYNSVTS